MSKNNSFLGNLRIREIIKKPRARVHFTGVGGVGMYSLFRLSAERGIVCTGSDRSRSPLLSDLMLRGADVREGSFAFLAERADLLVYTLAVSDDDPEIKAAHRLGIPTVSRAEYMSALSDDYAFKIGVSGSHGKSTVTAMLSEIFRYAGRDPTVISGASLSRGGLPLHIGSSSYFIYEACEYKDSFLKFTPSISVFTNLELDHVDYFKDLDSIRSSFGRAMELSGSVILNADDENLRSLIKSINKRAITCSKSSDADFRAEIVSQMHGCYSFELYSKLSGKIKVELKIPGEFNVSNALCAIAAATECGISAQAAVDAIERFSGIDRRLEPIGEYNGSAVYYDYAHHPTEIREGIKAVREATGAPVLVIFKPHTYSRTEGLRSDFISSLKNADRLIILDVDPVREEKREGVSSISLAAEIGDSAVYSGDDEVMMHIGSRWQGAIIIMGAADLGTVLSNFLKPINKEV